MKIELQTAVGQHVRSFQLPPFSQPPKVMIWGERVFSMETVLHGAIYVYRECFFYVVHDREAA